MMTETLSRPSPESLLAKLKESERANLRVYIGATITFTLPVSYPLKQKATSP